MWKIMRSVAKRLRARGLYGTLRYSCHRFSEWRHERRLGIMTGGFIRQSLLEAPRKLSLIYKYPATVGNLFDALPWLVKRRTYRCYTEYGETVVLYEAAGNGCILFPHAGAPG